MLLRRKNNIKIQEHPLTLLRIEVMDEHGGYIFHKPMWLMVFGNLRSKLSITEIYKNYMRRYDIEHFFKFSKRNLLIDKLQTSETQHHENWWKISLLSYCMLFCARSHISITPYRWETYLKNRGKKGEILSPSMVQRSFAQITNQLGSPATRPKPRGSPLGRKKGEKIGPKIRHPVVKKE